MKPAVTETVPAQEQRRRQRDARLLALVVALAGVVNVISGLTPSLAGRMRVIATGVTPDVVAARARRDRADRASR